MYALLCPPERSLCSGPFPTATIVPRRGSVRNSPENVDLIITMRHVIPTWYMDGIPLYGVQSVHYMQTRALNPSKSCFSVRCATCSAYAIASDHATMVCLLRFTDRVEVPSVVCSALSGSIVFCFKLLSSSPRCTQCQSPTAERSGTPTEPLTVVAQVVNLFPIGAHQL